MSDVIAPLDFFLLRTPRLPQQVALRANEHRDRHTLALYLFELYQSVELQDAIFLASEALHTRLMDFLKAGPDSIAPKLLLTLYKYTLRMAARTTPYGKFAGISLGEIVQQDTRMCLSGEARTHVRLDMAFAAHLTKWMLSHTDLARSADYIRNASLVMGAAEYRFMAYRSEHGQRHYYWVRLSRNPLLDRLLAYAQQARSFVQLAEWLAALGLSSQQVEDFLDKLITQQLLLSNLEPATTQVMPAATLGKRFMQFPRAAKLIAPIDKLLQSPSYVLPMTDTALGLNQKIPGELLAGFEGRPTLHADMRMLTQANLLRKQTVVELLQEVKALLPLHRDKMPNELAIFCTRFVARFQEREIPLLDALDPERGVGYGDIRAAYADKTKLLAGLTLAGNGEEPTAEMARFDRLISQHIDFGSETTNSIELTDADLQHLSDVPQDAKDLPTSLFLMGNLIAKDGMAFDEGDFLFLLQSYGGVSALPIMARFAHLDEDLETRLRACAAMEAQASPDVVFAEILFLPDDRTGNVMLRPDLRPHEIRLMGHAAVNDAFAIPVSDLWVRVVAGRVYLWSKKLGKMIVPRLSCAHNYEYSTTLYRFLCDVQHQCNTLSVQWNWGSYAGIDFLPRVVYKRIILARARWRIRSEEKAAVRQLLPLDAMALLRAKYDLPAEVVLAAGDNELLLALDHFAAAEILMQQLSKGDVMLYENLTIGKASPVVDRAGDTFLNELILPLRSPGKFVVPDFQDNSLGTLKRTFTLGSEWLYLKIYVGTHAAERLLTGEINTLIRQLKQQGLIERWFFVRYADPDPHIRLRLRLCPRDGQLPLQTLLGCIQDAFDGLLEQGVIQTIQYDTYEREVERYGVNLMEACEYIFQYDSEATVGLLPLFRGEKGEELRWLSALIGVDHLFDALSLSLDTRQCWVADWRNRFFAEFGADKSLKRQLDLKFRTHRALIEKFVYTEHNDCPVRDVLQQRRIQISSILKAKMVHEDQAASLSHMFLNRHFFVNQREQELVVYHFLTKLYRTMQSRNGEIALP